MQITFPNENLNPDGFNNYIFLFSQQDESADLKSENSRKKSKLVFISPFERYKRVMPMIVEEERKAREKAEQDEAERIKKLQKSQQETAASISRVHQHFVKVVQQNVVVNPKFMEDPESLDKKSDQMIRVNSRFDKIVNKQNYRSPASCQTLSQMHGKKRKRQLSPEVIRPFRNNKKKNADKANKRKR